MVFFTGFLVFMTVIGVISAKIDGWDTSPNTQYHIQTDEGPERYFRYQTISGQYRKEKRLQDGTVIGSYGWVDADGYLRLNDYIADNEGYRIVRTKRLYVGNQTPIDSALQSAKYVPPQAGTDVSSPTVKANIVPQQYPEDNSKFLLFPSSTQSPISSTTYAPDKSKFLLFPSSSPSSPPPPVSSTYAPDKSKFLIFPGSTPLSVSTVYAKRRPTPPAGYYPSSTPPTVLAHEAENDAAVAITPSTYVPVSKYYYPNKSLYKAPLYTSAKSRPEYNQNSISPSSSYFGDKVYSRKSFDNETPYDGVSVTRNGFKYFLPRQYHEENTAGQDRTGSFGYIDPFGIRRVVYYNASPGSGFVHRKNNRYVGFNATPYDPRP